jgi:hypothetical protein
MKEGGIQMSIGPFLSPPPPQIVIKRNVKGEWQVVRKHSASMNWRKMIGVE